MKHKLFRKANYVLAVAGLGIGLFLYVVDSAVESGYLLIPKNLMWVGFTLLFCFIGLVGGRMISILHHWAYRDYLTGVWNRKYFMAKLNHELVRKRETGAPLCLALIDIDDFKKVNDQYGHDYGDEVIKMVADTMIGAVRPPEAVVRLGGDEFVIVFSRIDMQRARKIAEQIRRAVSDRHMHVTVSVGLIEVNETDRPAELIRQLDNMLYRSKKTKNTVNTMVV